MAEPRILSLEGLEKCFKTTTAYTAPLPIVGFQFDMGVRRALYGTKFEEYFKDLKIEIITYKPDMKLPAKEGKPWHGNDITIFEYPAPIQLDSKSYRGCIDLWTHFMITYVDAMADPYVTTGVIDTMTLCRRTKADAHLEELQRRGAEKRPPEYRHQLLQIEWGVANDAIRTVYTTAQAYKKNLVAVHHLTEHYAPQVRDGITTLQPDGTMVAEGYNKTDQIVDWAVRHEKQYGQVKAKITVCGDATDLEGQEIFPITWNGLAETVESKFGGRIQFYKRETK